MGLLYPKPYKQFNRLKGIWELIQPKPVEFQVGIKRGGRNGPPAVKVPSVLKYE